MSEQCGSSDTHSGEACKRPAGWGTDSDIGPCVDHETEKSTMGRPSKFNDERAHEAIEAAKDGLSKAGCARAAGVDKSTLGRWLDKDLKFGGGKDFRNAFTRARAEGERKLVKGALWNDKNADREIDGQHARFLLSTSFDYIKTEKKEVENTGDQPMNVIVERNEYTE